MPKYLLLAEKISKNIKQDSSSNYLKSLNNLIIEIKKAITGTELKFLYNRPLAKVVIASSSDLPVQRLS
ncbi:hypothetical protein KTJ51_13470 [Acinetobacter baumannii]|nr:hypothetical protein APC99_01000 [Acinetobacter baumannii]MCT9211958.1 hypothetical protein [Acinetobacter baumannii]MCT9227509.1 hypothetical protein [Acinetobacter baumannii]MCT9267284.1 hypothetical protein [Acinetobacter baumannii]MCT9298405.1 hypothetical protein [Acinetobacter baumannii]